MMRANLPIKFTEIPKYPEVRRDLALLVDDSIKFDAIYNIARQSEKGLLKGINLFDVYQGNNLPEGKKSYAVSFTIQDATKTLLGVYRSLDMTAEYNALKSGM